MQTPISTWALATAAAFLMSTCGGGGDAAPAAATNAAVAEQAASPRAKALAVSTGGVVTPEEAARQLMDFGELQYPGCFPAHQATAAFDPFAYRYDPQTDTDLGVAMAVGAGDVLRGAFGSTATDAGTCVALVRHQHDGAIDNSFAQGHPRRADRHRGRPRTRGDDPGRRQDHRRRQVTSRGQPDGTGLRSHTRAPRRHAGRRPRQRWQARACRRRRQLWDNANAVARQADGKWVLGGRVRACPPCRTGGRINPPV